MLCFNDQNSATTRLTAEVVASLGDHGLEEVCAPKISELYQDARSRVRGQEPGLWELEPRYLKVMGRLWGAESLARVEALEPGAWSPGVWIGKGVKRPTWCMIEPLNLPIARSWKVS